jgi:hypothetical protein
MERDDMELREQGPRPTLAQKLGDVTHVSPLLHRVRQLSGCAKDQVGEWLLKCAVERGATHYRRDFSTELPPDNPALTNEELGVALCLAHHTFNPMLIRAAAGPVTHRRSRGAGRARPGTLGRSTCQPDKPPPRKNRCPAALVSVRVADRLHPGRQGPLC